MKKYKINYIVDDRILSTLYVHSETLPKIPDFDNKKYFIHEQQIVELPEFNVIDVTLKELIKKYSLDVYYNDTLIGNSDVIENNALQTISLENKFFENLELKDVLTIDQDWNFSGVNSELGYEVEYLVNTDKTRLFINEIPINFPFTKGIVKIDDNGNLYGLVAEEGYFINRLELGENDKIVCEVLPISLKTSTDKTRILTNLSNDFSEEEYQKTSKIMLDQIMNNSGKEISEKNLDYFMTQNKVIKNELDDSKSSDLKLMDFDDNIIDFESNIDKVNDTSVLDNKRSVKSEFNKDGIIAKIFSKFKKK